MAGDHHRLRRAQDSGVGKRRSCCDGGPTCHRCEDWRGNRIEVMARSHLKDARGVTRKQARADGNALPLDSLGLPHADTKGRRQHDGQHE